MNEEKILNEAFEGLNEIFKSNHEKDTAEEINLDKDFITESIRIMAKSYYNRSLIVFLGAGCSIEQKYPSWNKYIDNFLEFWTYHINNINSEKVVEQSDMQYIRSLKNRTDIQKKRKIDLAYEVISKYAPENFNEIKHDFESLQFVDSSPIKIENEYYNILSELDAFYITTNYDQQLEILLKSKGKLVSIYEDITKFIIDEERKTSSGLLYLHGTIGCNNDFLINSSESYINLYEKNKTYIKRFRDIINKDNTSILFIGSSMDEEEILSIFYGEELKCNVFSLLKSRDKVSNEIEDKYFKDKKNINILRFGNKHSDLKLYLTTLCDVLNKLHKDNSLFDVIKYKGEEKRVAEIDEDLSDSDLSLDKLERLHIYKNGDIFDATKYPKIWNSILNKTNINTLSVKVKLDLTGNILKSNAKVKNILSKFFIQNIKDLKMNPINEILDKMTNLFWWADYSIENDFYKGCVLLYNLDKNKLQYQEINTELIFKLDENQKIYIIKMIKNKDNDSKVSNINSIINQELGNNIKFLITNNALDFEDNEILKIFDYKYTQKIAVYLSNNKKLHNTFIAKYIKTKIDFNDEYFGKELNVYVKEHKVETTITTYKDYIGDVKFGSITEVPYLTKKEIIDLEIREIFQYIVSGKYTKIKLINFERYSDEAQNIEFNKLYDGVNNDLFYEIYKHIVNEDELFNRFGYGPLKIKLVNDKCLFDLLDIILSEFIKKNIFNFEVKKFYEDNIENSFYNLENKLYRYDVNILIKKDKHTNIDEIKLNEFINWNIGRYIDVIIKLNKTKDVDIEKIISNIRKQEIKNYLKGVLFEKIPNQIDDKNSFIGFSHNYIIDDKVYKEYKESIFKLLEKGTSDDFIIINLFRSAIFYIPSKNIEKISFELIKKFIPYIPEAYDQIGTESNNIEMLIDSIIKEKELDDLLLKNWFNRFIRLNSESQHFIIEKVETIKSTKKTIEPYGISSNIYGVEKNKYSTIKNYNELLIILINNKWFEQNDILKYQLESLFKKYKDLECKDLILDLLNETKDFIKPFYDQLIEANK